MDSPEPSKNNNNGSSSASALNNNNNNSPESLQEESSYFRYVSSLSPINIKASHGTGCFIGLNSPPLVFKSPRISNRQKQFMQRTQEARSQSENGEAPEYYWKSNFHQPLLERFIIDTQKVFDPNIDTNTQHYGGNLSIYKYLADPGDIDQMYSADQDVEQQSTVAAETSLSYPTQSNILNIGTKDGLGDKESFPLSEDSGKFHQQIPVYGEEPEKMERELSDVEKQYSRDPLLPQATLTYHDVGRRRLQFEEGASSAIGSNKSHEKLSATSNNVKRIELVESVASTLYSQQGCGNLPLHLNSVVNAMPTIQAATTGVRLPDSSPGINMKRSILKESSVEARIDSHDVGDTGAGNSEEFNKSPSPGKKKKKTSIPANQGGCRRCNCKKSKCIKLYCECFNAGVYCIGTCGCEDCYNRPQYEGMIMECRRQIESRNQENSARVKRGCKCKRSTCLKKYCECYQAKVGCSSGCRCQGCKNSYGKKEDYVASQHSSSTEMVTSETDYDLRILTPIAPPLQCSDKGKEAAKSRVISGKYLSPPESEANVFSSCSNKSQSSEDEHSNNNQWKSVSPSRFSPLTPNTRVSETQHLHGPISESTLFNI